MRWEKRTAGRLAVAALLVAAPFDAMAQSRRPAAAAPQPSLREALGGGTVDIRLRYRFELVDQTGLDATARASTLRTVLGYRSRPWKGFAVRLQAENVSDVGGSRLHANAGFGDRGNGVTGRPVIADSPGTDMLEAYAEYANDSSRLRVGRQELSIGDERFVGAVGWRQHHQSFRAISLHDESFAGVTLDYAYVDRVFQVTGRGLDAGHHLISAAADVGEAGSLTGYAYLLRYDAMAQAGLSTNTYGVELTGDRTVGQVPVRYAAEFAHQRAAGDNPLRINADYLHLMLGVDVRGVAVAAGMERLGGSAADGQFNTPLATLHVFNGWADKFPVTPANGLRDMYLQASGSYGTLGWSATYHRFDPISGGGQYGTEIDALLTYRAPWEQTLALKASLYSADTFSSDTTKLWFYTSYAF